MSRETRVAQLDTLIDEIVTAQLAGNDAEALLKAEAASTILASIPDANREASGYRYRQLGIDNLIARLQKKVSANFSTVKVRHIARPTDGTNPSCCAGGY